MAQSYTRQSTFSDGDTITAALFNNEYNQLVNAFTYSSSSASSTGHRHDGTAGHGGNIHTIGDLDFLNKIVVDSTNNRWGFFVEVSSAAVEQIRIQDGAIVPVTDNDIDLGTSSLEFKDAYFDGTITTDLLTVSGATNLDGAIQVDNTITVGVDDTGYDVKFFGDTASAYMLWDASADDLVLAGAAGLDVAGDIDVDGTSNLDNTDIDGTLAVDGTTISLDATTSLNIDNSNTSNGITIGTATSGVPVSIGHTTSEVTVNDNLTVTGTLTLGSGAELTEAELEMLDGITAGTVAASKAVVVDSNKDAASFRNITLTGELDAGSLDVSGDADIDGTLETDALSINGTAVTSTAAELNILDGVTSTAAELNILDGVTASATDINLIDGITNGTVIASKAIITDANKDISGGRNITISGELDAATLDISGDADIDGTLEADAITIGGTTLAETISDTVGAMVGSNTETGITVTYEDGDNTLDFVIGTLNQDTTGTADNITVSANNSTDETVYPIFVDGATGSQGAESDTGLTYNPSSGMLTTTGVTATFTGNITGNVTGNTSGTAATVTGAAQSNITSLGTLTTLTVDNVIVNGTTIGHTSDTDLITLADGNVTIAGELDLTTLDVSGDADIDGTLEADAITVGGTALASVIAGTTVSNATLASTVTVSDSTANTNFPVVFHDESNALLDDTGALRYNPSTGELLVPKLTVAGTTTTADTVTMQASNAIVFEGATADANETTLSIVDPTSDHTQYLVNQGGYIPVLAAATTTQISSTPAELNLLDGSSANTVVNSKAVIYGSSGELAGTLSTAAQTNITSLGTLTTLTVDDITINGSTISDGGEFTIDAEDSINLDADGAIIIKQSGTEIGRFSNSSNNLRIQTAVSDADLVFRGNDGGSTITALTLDMSAAGAATFNNFVDATNYKIGGAQGSDGQVLTSTGSGVAWETPASGGANAINDLSDAKTFGTSSIMIGDATTGTISAANYNTGVGINIFEALTTGDENVAMGYASLNDLTTGSKNTTIGATAGAKITTGTDNTAMGADALKNVTTTNNSTAFGKGALLASTAEGNTAVGKDSQLATTTGYRNVSMGKESLMTNTTGDQNVAIGNNALELSTTADNNTALGYNALNATTTGATNVAVGSQTLAANTTASDNTGVGYAVLLVNTTGSNNTGVGVNSLQANTTASENVAVGKNTMIANTTGAQNVAVGANALDANTTAANNTAVGYNAMTGNTTGTANVAVGTASLVSNTTASNNVAIGYAALNANTTGSSLTAVGKDALLANTDGENNIGIGRDAGQSITTGSNTIAIGVEALEAQTEANANLAIGKGAGAANTTGTENVFIGHEAGNDVTTGAGHTIIGFKAGDKITTASQNTAVGDEALGANTGGSLNTAIGYNAMLGNTTGGDCTAVGARALDAANAADGNTAVGSAALGANTTGAQNTALGTYALDANTTTHYSTGLGYDALTACTSAANTGVGAYAGTAITTGDGNTCVGFEAGDSISTGTDNVMIGKRAGDDQTTGNSNTVIGSTADSGSGSATGRLVLGQNTAGTGDARATLGYNGNKVEIDLNGSDESWAASSDERLKENVQDATVGLQFINELRPITYQWKKKKDVPTDMPQYEKDSNEPSVGLEYGVEYHGFIAQEVKAVIDKHDDVKDGQNIWKTGDDEVQKIAKGGLIPMLVKAVQELSAEVEQLKSKIKEE